MQAYVKMFFSFLDETNAMTDAEVGRLVRQIVEYGRTGNTDKYLKGNEKYVFPIYKTQIDRDSERYAAVSRKRAEAGKAGGLAKASKCYQELANPSKSSQEEGEEEDKDKGEEKEEDKESISSSSNSSNFSVLMPSKDSIEAYVSSNIDRLSAGNFEELTDFMEDLPDDLIRYAVDECCANGKRTFGYLRSILQSYLRDNVRSVGEAKARSERFKLSRTAAGAEKSSTMKANPALNYAQRKYTDDDFKGFFEDLGG